MNHARKYLAAGFCAMLAFPCATAFADSLETAVKFHTRQEAVARLLPGAATLTERKVELTEAQSARLRKLKNWDGSATEFTFYHAKNRDGKITRTVVIFPETTLRGTLVLAVALANDGRIADILMMEAQNSAVDWIMPLLRADYLRTLTGKDKNLRLQLDGKFKTEAFSPLVREYALILANAAKKSAQLFHVVFKEKK